MKEGTFEQRGTCEDTLEVTPVKADGDAIDDDVVEVLGTEHEDKEVGKTFIVSTISVKIITW